LVTAFFTAGFFLAATFLTAGFAFLAFVFTSSLPDQCKNGSGCDSSRMSNIVVMTAAL
jgi:hypothetical protein